MSLFTQGGSIAVAPSGLMFSDGGAGGISNGASVTITGGPFGTKSGSSPSIWDHGQDGAGVLNAGWSGAWPNAAGNSIANTINRAQPFQALGSSTINGPHPYTTTFLAGNHYQSGAFAGNNVMPYVAFSTPALPYYSYWSWYTRDDPQWWHSIAPFEINFTGTLASGNNVITAISSFTWLDSTYIGASISGTGIPSSSSITAINSGAGTITINNNVTANGAQALLAIQVGFDNNNKRYDFSAASTPYDTSVGNWYLTYADYRGVGNFQFSHPTSNTDLTAKNGILDDTGGALTNPDQNGHNAFWRDGNNPTNVSEGVGGNGWQKSELLIKWTTATTGYVKYFENNTYLGGGLLVVDYAGKTIYTGITSASESIGGYSRRQGVVPADTTHYLSTGTAGTYTLWRYYADVYYDRQTTGQARFVMTNSATYVLGDGNIVEIQPYTAWANGSVTLTINKGNLSSGTAKIWFVDEVNGVSTPALQSTITLN
jgi:hypothetical protein